MGILDKLGEAWRNSAPPADAKVVVDTTPPAPSPVPAATGTLADQVTDRVVDRAADVMVERALAAVRGAVDRVGASFLDDAEGMLRQGEADRAHRPVVGPDPAGADAVAAAVLAASVVGAEAATKAAPPKSPPTRLEKENKARVELAALKAKLKGPAGS